MSESLELEELLDLSKYTQSSKTPRWRRKALEKESSTDSPNVLTLLFYKYNRVIVIYHTDVQ